MADTGNWSPYHITAAGRALRQHCIAESKQVVFNRAAIGAGKITDPAAIETMTNLAAYATDVIVKKSYAIEANHLCIVRVDNSGYTNDVLMSEIAVFAKSSDQSDDQAVLYGYAYNATGYVYIPAQTSTTNRKIFEITLDTYLSRTADVQIVYDGSSLWVSHADLDDLEAELRQHNLAEASHPYILSQLVNKVDKGTPQKYTFDYTSGYTHYYRNTYYYKTADNQVHLVGSFRKGTGVVTDMDHIATLPVGFRPTETTEQPIIQALSSTGSAAGLLRIGGDGTILAIGTGSTAYQAIFVNLCFLAA